METIGKYKVLRVLGRGGMGTVYEALDPAINRKVAIKTMIQGLADTPDLRERFLREAQAAGGLRHRNIVTVYDLGEDERGQPYIAMEYIEGTDIEKLIQNREPLSLDQKLDVLQQVCDGLGYAHRSGIVHRDIKPANIRLTPEGDVKIMDFGIAHLQSSTMTKSGLVLGTVHYMAPEQIDGHKVDHRADIFSVGAIAYELISYRKPFEGDSLTGLMFKIMHERPDPAHLPRTQFSPRLEGIVMKALARDVQDRYQTLDAMHDDLERLQRDHGRPAADPSSARSPAAPPGETVVMAPPVPAGTRLVQEGRQRLENGDAAAAIDLAQQAMARDPLDSGAQALLREAEGEALGRRVAREMGEIRADMERARNEGQLQKALSLGKRLLELDPDDASVARETAAIQATIQDREIEQLCGLALAYAADGDVDLALKITGKIERIDAKNPHYLELKTYLLEQAALRKAEVFLATAREQLSLGNLEQARDAADQALAVHPGHGPAREIRDAANRILAVQGKGSVPAPPPATPMAVVAEEPDDDFAPVDLAVLEDSETAAGGAAAAPAERAQGTEAPAPNLPATPVAAPPPARADAPPPARPSDSPASPLAPRLPQRAPSPFAPRPAPLVAARGVASGGAPALGPQVTVKMSPPVATPTGPLVAAYPGPPPAAPPIPPAAPPSGPLAVFASPPAAAPQSQPVPATTGPTPVEPGPTEPAPPPSPIAATGSPAMAASSPPPEALTPIPEGEPTNPEAARLVEAARRHLRERSSSNALPLLEQAATLEPSHAGIQRLLARTRAEARRAEIEALTTAALEHFVQNDSGKARRAVEKALALDPQNRKARELSKILGVLG